MEEEKLVGFFGLFEKKLYSDLYSGYSIFKIRPQLNIEIAEKLQNGLVSCKGTIPEYVQGTPLYVEGIWEIHPKFGWSLIVKDSEVRSYDNEVTKDFLLSIKGIGSMTADKIIEEFPHPFEDLKAEDASQRLAKLIGCSLGAANLIVDNILSSSHQREIMKYIFPFGGKMHSVRKLNAIYGAKALTELKKDPFTVGINAGLSLETCDAISEEQNLPTLSASRLNAYINDALEKSQMRGNVYDIQRDVFPNIQKRMKKRMGDETSALFLSMAVNDSPQFEFEKAEVEGQNRIYLKFLKNAEDSLAEQIKRLMINSVPTNYSDEYQSYAEQKAGFEFAPEQRSAFNLLKQTGVGILTGGPGTGKTTTLKGMIDAYEKMYPNNCISLCAPTGRAAQRMSESTGREATTIHRLIGYTPYASGEIKCRDEHNPLEADLIVIDETSMLDVVIANLLFKAIKTGSMVIMVGDINQLQSVGAGDVLNDLIRSEIVPVERLIKTYRQASHSKIISNAQRINEGLTYLAQGEDFEIYEVEDVTTKVCELTQQYFKRDDPFYVQVLSPSHMGDGGTQDVNKKLQAILNAKNGLFFAGVKYSVGDKILMTRNNPQKGYYNGDVGIILSAAEDDFRVKIGDETIQIEHELLNDIKLAYSMTIHKSQGSEFQVVIVALPRSNMLKRNLLYTAITRAKQKVIVVEQPGAINFAVKHNEVGKRHTSLIERLKE